MINDAQLLADYVRNGDVNAFASLVANNSKWLGAYVRGLCANDADAEDAVQDVWVRLIKACGSFRGGSVKAYLTRIARSVVIDRHRRNGHEAVSLDDESVDGQSISDNLCDASPFPNEMVAKKYESTEIRRLVRALPRGQREVLLLRIEGELSFKEIAAELDIPIGTALTWMRAATLYLKKELGEKDE